MKTVLFTLAGGLLLTSLVGCHRHEPLTSPDGGASVRATRFTPTKRTPSATLVRVLADRHLSPDAPVMPYLPPYWHKAMFMNLTFRDFLRAASGQPAPARRAHWAALLRLARGYGFRADHPAYHYADAHDPFFRVLVAGLNGYRWSGNADTDQRMATLYFDAQAKFDARLAVK
jgi:hypothetical protein